MSCAYGTTFFRSNGRRSSPSVFGVTALYRSTPAIRQWIHVRTGWPKSFATSRPSSEVVEFGEGVACGVQGRCVVGLGVFQVVEDVFDVVGVEGFGEPGVEGFGELVFA
jgi:hypothetical protein